MAKTESCLVETEDIKSLSDQQNRTPKVFCLTFGVQFFFGAISRLLIIRIKVSTYCS